MLEQSELQFIKDKEGKTCPHCGGEVAGQTNKVYCSKRCSSAAWRKANPEKVKELRKKWVEANPEKHKESVRKASKKWKKANPEKANSIKRRWEKANPEKHKESARKAETKWRKANPEKRKAIHHRRRARLKGNGIEDTSDYRARMTHPLVRQVCFYCGKDCTGGEFHWDHRIPIAAGGPDAEWNLVIACPPCNLKKDSKVPKTLFAEEIFNEP